MLVRARCDIGDKKDDILKEAGRFRRRDDVKKYLADLKREFVAEIAELEVPPERMTATQKDA